MPLVDGVGVPELPPPAQSVVPEVQKTETIWTLAERRGLGPGERLDVDAAREGQAESARAKGECESSERHAPSKS